MSHIYSIQYSLKDDSILLERIKSLGIWMSYFPNNIFVKSTLEAREVYNKISVGYETDRILIIEVVKTSYWGVMPKDVWEWLKSS